MKLSHQQAIEGFVRILRSFAETPLISSNFPESIDKLPVVFSGGIINILGDTNFGDIDMFVYKPEVFSPYGSAWENFRANQGSTLTMNNTPVGDMNSPLFVSRTFKSLNLEIRQEHRSGMLRWQEQAKLNVIIPDRYIHPLEIVANFDFANIQWYYDVGKDEMHMPDYVFEAVINKRLEVGNHYRFNLPGEEPQRIKRILKYERRGYKLSDAICNYLGKNQGIVNLVREDEKRVMRRMIEPKP